MANETEYSSLFRGAEDQEVKTECPKCGSESAWMKVEGPDLWLRCLCGVNKLMATVLKSGVTVEHGDTEAVALPRRSTKLWDALTMVITYGPCKTDYVAEMVNFSRTDVQTVNEVSSQLAVLRHKNLIERLESRKGVPGGSTWQATKRAKELMGCL